jgi:hypothetical protein
MKQIPIEFLQMLEQDIEEIDNLLINDIVAEIDIQQLHLELDGKYQACVKDWGKSMYGFNENYGFAYSMLDKDSLIHNISMMKSKLTTYKYQVNAVPNIMPPTTNVTVNVDNKIDLKFTFESARSQIENNNSLTMEQTEEINKKIDDIEQIIISKGNMKAKWEKVKPILFWLADKSVDVGTALLPLILKIQ